MPLFLTILTLLYQAVLSLTALPNGLLVSGSSDRSIRLWNIYQHTNTDTTTTSTNTTSGNTTASNPTTSGSNNSNSTYNTIDYTIKANINFTDACVKVLEGQKGSGCLIV